MACPPSSRSTQVSFSLRLASDGVLSPPPSTTRDYVARQAAAVAEEKKKLIKRITSPPENTITVSGRTVKVRANFTVIHDNCTSKSGGQFMGLGVVVAMTQTELGGAVIMPTVRPKAILLAYDRFTKLTGDAKHDAPYYAEAEDRRLRAAGVDPEDCGDSAYDTTNVNRLAKNTTKIYQVGPLFYTASLAHANGIPCAIHECNCLGTHVGKIPLMKSVIDSANDLSK